MPLSYYFIVNPAAGGGKRLSCLSDIQDFCRTHGITHELSLTKSPQHATELARKASRKYQVVVAVGGDGTINEVSTGLIGTQAALGIIPTGSGNDFSHEVGYGRTIHGDLHALLGGTVERVDVGRVNGQYYFINIFGVGFDGEVSARAVTYKKVNHGFVGYLFSVLHTLAAYQFHQVSITIDAYEPIKKEIFFVAVANGSTYGGGFHVAPGAKIDDGFFSICIVEKTTKWYALRNLPKFMKGTHVGLPPVQLLTGRHIVIESSDPLQAQADGELPPPAPRFEITLMPRALNVITVKK